MAAKKKARQAEVDAQVAAYMQEMTGAIEAMTPEEIQATAALALGQQGAPQGVSGGPSGPAAATTAQRRKFVASGEWENFVASRYPGLLQIYKTNPEIAEIIRTGYIQQQTPEEIATNISSSTWYKGLGSGEYDYITKTTTGDKAYADKIAARENSISDAAKARGYTLSPEAIKKIAGDSLKANWDTPEINDAIGRQIVGESQSQTPTGTPTAAPTALQQGADAAALRELSRRYGLSLSDNEIEGYVQASLRGEITAQQITNVFRNQAKSLYPSFAAQLDAGDLDSAVGTYKSIASQVLGVDPTRVDFTNDKFKKLLTYKDPDSGESRPMNATEWGNYLRTLPEWKKTAEASDRYRTMIDTVDELFGKVR
jgi:hypothetical protein